MTIDEIKSHIEKAIKRLEQENKPAQQVAIIELKAILALINRDIQMRN